MRLSLYFQGRTYITGIEKKVVGEMVRPKGDEVSNLGYLMTSLVFYTVHLMKVSEMQAGTATVMGQTRNDVGVLVWNCLEYVHLEDREWDAVPRHIGCLVER